MTRKRRCRSWSASTSSRFGAGPGSGTDSPVPLALSDRARASSHSLSRALRAASAFRRSLASDLRHYFNEEVKGAWIFLAVGLVALLAGLWLWRSQSAFKHACWPLAAVALLQMGAGAVIVLRIPAQEAALEQSLAQQPAAFKAQESQRMAQLLDAFRFYKLAEIALVLMALGLALFLPHNVLARGWGLGLLIQSTFLLSAGLVAELRAETYLDAIRRL